MNNVLGKLKISYLLVEIYERPLNIPKRPSIENIGILYIYGPGVRSTEIQRPVRSKQITLVLLSGLLSVIEYVFIKKVFINFVGQKTILMSNGFTLKTKAS